MKNKPILLKTTRYLLLIISTTIFIVGCQKEKEIPPTMEFKKGDNYTYSNALVTKDSVLLVGIVVDKTEDDLKTFNVSVANDDATTTKTMEEVEIPESKKSHFDVDITINVGSQAATEKWYFTVTDVDGNIAQKILIFFVQ